VVPGDGVTEQLAGHTTFGIGGPASQFVDAHSIAELVDAIRGADADGEPLFVLSGGSNVLVADDGFAGTVVHVANRGIQLHIEDESVLMLVSAGEPMDALVATSVEHGWSGLESLSGIPGLVGAAPVQNIGAYGSEIASVVVSVGVWDRTEKRTRILSAADCRFGYRDSVIKSSRAPGQATGRYVVLEVLFQLLPTALSAPIAYAELAGTLGAPMGAQVPIGDVRAAVLDLRRAKGMVFDKADPDTHGAGSFFTNPVLTSDDAVRLPAEAPRYQQPDGRVKTSAAWLIDHAGYKKGFGDARARVSAKHTLALTNQGGASATEVIALARTIRAGVEAKYGIILQPEPVLVGLDF